MKNDSVEPVAARRSLLRRCMDRFYRFDVFICYTRKDDPDGQYANALFVKLANEKPRLTCFQDIKGLNRDETLSEAIAGRLRESRFVVILAGSASGERPTVLAEAKLAVEAKEADHAGRSGH